MSNYDAMKSIIRRFSGQENIIGVPRPYCEFMDDLGGGVFLSQIIFWSDKGGGEPGWFYKSYREWKEELLLSRYMVKKYTEKLEGMGVLETKLKRANGAPTVHYRFDYEKFTNRFIEFSTNGSAKISQSITETTQKNTTDTTDDPSGPNGYTAELTRLYEEVTNRTINGNTFQEIEDYWQDIPDIDAWRYAFRQARDKGAPWPYAKAILESKIKEYKRDQDAWSVYEEAT